MLIKLNNNNKCKVPISPKLLLLVLLIIAAFHIFSPELFVRITPRFSSKLNHDDKGDYKDDTIRNYDVKYINDRENGVPDFKVSVDNGRPKREMQIPIYKYKKDIDREEEKFDAIEIDNKKKHTSPKGLAIIRLIPNDNSPEQKKGTSYQNLKYLLEHETGLPHVTRFWVVDRILDKMYEKKILDLLKSYGETRVLHKIFESNNAFEKTEQAEIDDILRNTYRTMKRAHNQIRKKSPKNIDWFIVTTVNNMLTKEAVDLFINSDVTHLDFKVKAIALKSYSLVSPQRSIQINHESTKLKLNNIIEEGHIILDQHIPVVVLHRSSEFSYGAQTKTEYAMAENHNCFVLTPKECLILQKSQAYVIRLYNFPNFILPDLEGKQLKSDESDNFAKEDKHCSPHRAEDFDIKSPEEARFVMYRIYGNDMPPLQKRGQLLWNLKYTLENEKRDFPGLTKRFVLNRIIDEDLGRQMIALLESYGYKQEYKSVVSIPFELSGLRTISKNTTHLLQYATNLNQVRNKLIELAKNDPMKFHWILIFDGNQFITNDAWTKLFNAGTDKDRINERYFSVPMCRMMFEQNDTVLNQHTTVHDLVNSNLCFMQEPQLMLRWNSCQDYDLKNGYGKRSKLQLLSNLGCDKSGGLCTEAGYSLRLYPYPDDSEHEAIKIIIDHSIRHKARKQSLENFGNLLLEMRQKAIDEQIGGDDIED